MATDYSYEILLLCTSQHLEEPTSEYKFHPTRRWKFDYAWPDKKVAVEIEGGLWVYGRHTRGTGYKNDLEKYNKATEMGWKILRYAADDFTNPERQLEVFEQIERVIRGEKNVGSSTSD